MQSGWCHCSKNDTGKNDSGWGIIPHYKFLIIIQKEISMLFCTSPHLNIDKNEHFFDHLPPLPRHCMTPNWCFLHFLAAGLGWSSTKEFWKKNNNFFYSIVTYNYTVTFSLFRNNPLRNFSIFPFFDNAKGESTLIWA